MRLYTDQAFQLSHRDVGPNVKCLEYIDTMSCGSIGRLEHSQIRVNLTGFLRGEFLPLLHTVRSRPSCDSAIRLSRLCEGALTLTRHTYWRVLLFSRLTRPHYPTRNGTDCLATSSPSTYLNVKIVLMLFASCLPGHLLHSGLLRVRCVSVSYATAFWSRTGPSNDAILVMSHVLQACAILQAYTISITYPRWPTCPASTARA